MRGTSIMEVQPARRSEELSSLWNEVRYAARQLRLSPGFALTAIITLAIGVGANSAVFTLTHAIMLKSLPVADPGQLYRVGDNDNCCVWGGFQDDWGLFSHPLYEYLRDHTSVFQDMAAVQSWESARISVRPWDSQGAAESQFAEWVSGNYFRTLGIQPLLGRTLTPADDDAGAPPVAVMSYRVWQKKFGGSASVVGSAIAVNGKAFTVAGVAPPGFFGDRIASDPPDFWLPLSTEPLLRGDRALLNDPNEHWLYILGRLPTGTVVAPVQAQMNVELRQWLGEVPRLTANQRARIDKQKLRLGPGAIGIANLATQVKPMLYLLTAASAMVLLIACANLANLLLARAAARRQQVAIRTALGASRTRLIAATLTESVLLSLMGGIAGLVVAYAGARTIVLFAFRTSSVIPIDAAPSLPVLGFTFAVAVFTGILFGVAPAWLASRSDPVEALRGAGRSTRDSAALPQRTLVVVQAALSLVLLAAAGLITQSLRNLEKQDFHFSTDHRYLAFFDPELAGYSPERLQPMYSELQDRLRAIPGVRSAAFGMYVPQGQDNWSTGVFVEGRKEEPGKERNASWDRITPDYFTATGTPVLRGRAITQQDTPSSNHVAVVNEAFVKKFFPNEDPLGRHFGKEEAEHAGDYEIVGVVADAKYQDPSEPARAMYFLPLTQTVEYKNATDRSSEQRSLFANQIVLWVNGKPANLEAQVRGVLASVNPDLALLRFHTYDAQVSANLVENELLSGLTGIFSILALLLASLGLYGVTSYRVARRSGEIGIRMALGATPRNVVVMVLRSAFALVVLGLVIGVPLAIGAGKVMGSKLFGVGSHDVRVLGAAALALALAAFVACILPARTAAAVEPMQALRTE